MTNLLEELQRKAEREMWQGIIALLLLIPVIIGVGWFVWMLIFRTETVDCWVGVWLDTDSSAGCLEALEYR